MKILITGANGFVGQHLVSSLLAEHHVVAAVRKRGTNFPAGVEIRLVPPSYSMTGWTGVLENIDVVVHLAARVHVMKERSVDPLEAFREINVVGTANLARCCVEQGVKRFIFMSSIKVNGEMTGEEPFTALSAPAPVDPYGVSKLEAEQELANISAQSGLELITLRPTLIYGPNVKGNIDRMVRLVRTGLPLPLGAIRNKRTLLSVDNLARWVSRAIIDAVPSGPVLVGDLEPISTPDLVRSLAYGMGVRCRQISIPVGFMRGGAHLLGQEALAQRLLADLAIAPTVEAFPGIENSLESTQDGLANLGRISR